MTDIVVVVVFVFMAHLYYFLFFLFVVYSCISLFYRWQERDFESTSLTDLVVFFVCCFVFLWHICIDFLFHLFVVLKVNVTGGKKGILSRLP